MFEESIILKLNPQLGLLNDIFQDTNNLFRESTVSNYLQIAVSDVFHTVKDKSLFSIEIERQLNTFDLRYHLSAKRFNFLQTLNLEGINHSLDLSEDFGGVAHFLADKVGSVDALKVDSNKARLSLLRCANKQNICHLSEDFDKINWPTNHYDLIVLGDIEALKLNKAEQDSLLAKLQLALTDKGVLVVNVKNRDNISKWLDASSSPDNVSLPFQELYKVSADSDYSRKQLLDTIAASNFSSIDIHATFSKHNDFQNLFSEDYISSNLNAINHFYRIGAIDNDQLSEYLLFKTLTTNRKRIIDLASRYLVLASSSSHHSRKLYNNDFTHFAGTSRRPQWRTITSRFCGSGEVSKTSIYPDLHPDVDVISQDLSNQPYLRGRLLVDDWISAIVDNDTRAFRELVNEYADWLHELEKKDDFSDFAYDLLPFNILLNERGGERQYQIIDKEWKLGQACSADFVLFRALFWFAFENKAILSKFAKHSDLASISNFVIKFMANVSQINDLQQFVDIEEAVQSSISGNFRKNAVAHALLQSFYDKHDVSIENPMCQITWGDQKGIMDEEHAVFAHWEHDEQACSLKFKLPIRADHHTVLRLDPIANKGVFCISSMRLLDASQNAVLDFASAAEIEKAATLVNTRFLSTDDRQSFIALNGDPHLLFDLGELLANTKPSTLELELALLHGDWYQPALGVLTQTVNQQNNALVRQENALHEYRAELEFTKLRLENVIEHRTDLSDMNNILQRDFAQRKHELNLKVVHLNDQLVAQLGRNVEMENFLMMRPSTRIKRFLTRNLNRFRGTTTISEDGESVDDPTPAELDENLSTDTTESNNNANNHDSKNGEDSTPESETQVDEFPSSGELLGQNTEDYQLWVSENTLSDEGIEQAKSEIESMQIKPIFSILVPVYNVDVEYLIAMIRSVQAQIYPHWQLCIVDDASPKTYLRQILEHEAAQDSRISVQLNDINQGISLASNDALALATGDYVGLLDHDDELSIDALYENAKVINTQRRAGLIYSDEDKMDMQGNRLEPFFKPDYSPDLLDTNNYVCHFTVIKKDIVDEIGGFREGLDGSQDHDIILRAIAKADQVVHIPKVLYHWRKIPGSTAVVYDSKSYAWEAGRKAVESCLNQHESGVHVEFGTLKGTYRVFRDIKGEPLVSIIIPFKDKPELLNACLDSILARTTYSNFEIVGVSNNSEEAETLSRMQHYTNSDPRIRFVEKNIPFNFSAICNYGATQAKGDYLLFLNNDIEIISPDWIERLLEHAQRPQIGAVGGKLLYPDGRIQHAGVVAGMVGAAGHPHKFFPDNHIGYHGRLHMVYNVSAVTGAMLMVAAAKFKQAGGFDEENLAVAYNDIDLCLSLLNQGYLNVFTPHCKATHYESISRGYEDTQEKLNRLKKEQDYFLKKWADFLAQGDPFYNPNLSLKNERFSLNFND